MALQSSAVIIFAAIYNFLDASWVSSEAVLFSVVMTSLAGYLVFETLLSRHRRSRRNDFKHVLIFVSFGLGLA